MSKIKESSLLTTFIRLIPIRLPAYLIKKLPACFPNDPSLLAYIGSEELQHSNYASALELLKRSISIRPNDPNAYFSLGVTLEHFEKWSEALSSFEQAISINFDMAEAHYKRGNMLSRLGRFDEALVSYDRAIALNPNDAAAHNNRGIAFYYLGRIDDALDSFGRVIVLKPSADAYNNYANILRDQGRFEEALLNYDQAVALDPSHINAHINRSNTLREVGRLDEALVSIDQIIKLNPHHALANFNKACLKLLTGDLADGLRLYEWRWQSGQIGSPREFPQPLWLGEQPITGKTLLIHAEQGLGDTIQFCRYAAMAEALGARIILEVPISLVSLLSTLKGSFEIVGQGKPLPAFDLHCPMMSLPLAFETTMASIPAPIPYLFSDNEKKAYWARKLGAKSKLRVGLVWSGGFRPNQPDTWSINQRRNIPLSRLAELITPNIEFYSLQKGENAEKQLKELYLSSGGRFEVIDYTGEFGDFSDTAAFLDNLDLVIAVDTSTAHLAGAMGKQVWLLNRYDTDWRWFTQRSDSPWYPTLTLFRQEKMGDWSSVIQEVKNRLRDIA
jgi:tetratricopeptide (TPR) repeat protein